MKVVSNSDPEMASIVSSILNENQTEITKIITIRTAFVLIEGKEPKLTYVSGCACYGEYCNTPIIHGFRFDDLSVEELEKKWKKKR